MNKKIIFFVTVVSFFMILNFSKLALAEDCVVTIDTTHSLTVTCGNADYNVSFLACGYIGNDNAATFTVSIGGVSRTFQLLVNQSRTLSNEALFKLNSVFCAANQTQNPSTAVYSITPVLSQNCVDSDNGKNYYINGNATKGNVSSADCCAVNLYDTNCVTSSFFINERYCDASGNINTEDVQCPTGYYCKNGACANQPYCYDSDNGTNYYVKGYVDSSMAPGKTWDVCVNSTLLDEYQCNPYVEGADLGTNYNCPYGCKDGACLPAPPKCVASASSGGNSCTDSDSGKNYFVKGYSHVSFATGVSYDREDTCNPTGYYPNLLREWCCLTDGTTTFEDYTCTNGCANGACINSTQTTSCDGSTNSSIDAYSYGSQITVGYSDGTHKTFTDGCGFSSGSGDVGTTHYFCGYADSPSNQMPWFWSVMKTCPNGCANGACVQGTACDNVVTNGDFEIGTLNGWYSNDQNIKIVNKNSYPQYVFSGNYSVNVTEGTFQQQGIALNSCGGYPKNLSFAVFLKENTVAVVSLIAYPSSGIGTNGNPILYMIYDPNTYKCSNQGNTICIPEYETEKWYYIERDIQSDLTKTGYNSGPYYSAYISLGTLGSYTLGNTAYYDNVKLGVGKIPQTNGYNVTIQASDSSDSYVRDWNIFTYDPTGTYKGGGVWSGGTPLKTSYYTRSGTWSFNLDSGTYYLVIGQNGGVSYGTYSGQISVNGVNMQFTNADINHAIKFDVPLQVTKINTCVNHDECSQACDNLGISSHWMGSGSYRKAWEGTCPSSVYGCMTGDCCIGQCNNAGSCWCDRTNVVDIYGNVCPTGSTCGQDCSCHPTGGTGGGYGFSVKTDKYSYSPGDEMKITATLSGNSSMDFSGAIVTTTVGGISITMNPIGTGTSACTSSATGTTCSVSTTYYFVGNYEVPSDMKSGVYNVLSTVTLNSDRKDATANFQIGSSYKDYVDVSISPHEQNTIIGNEVDYYVTIIDKHPAMACPAIVGSNCTSQSYDYIIDVEGLPYHTVVPSDVNVYAGGLKTFELKVFPSSVKTSEGITATAQSTNATSSERSVGITGKVVATQASSETIPVKEALFKFAVKAYLKDDATVSHSDAGILHVKFVQTTQPTPFPNTEKMNVELRKGWNLISLPGKGSGFTQGSCSANQKPIAFVYIPDKQTFASMDEAISAMGNEELLNHLSTHSFWVYSYEDCNIGFNVGSYSTYSGLAVDSGWNLLGITKDMVGETLSNIKGDCVFEKIYSWDSSSQSWVQMSENDLIDKMSYGIAVKASAACVFKANFIQPPAFPGG